LSCLVPLLTTIEINDFGYPQNSDPDTLKLYITTETLKSERAAKEDSSRITIQATGAMSWRRADIKHRKNEAFVDVIEKVNLLMSSSGMVDFYLIKFYCLHATLGTILRADVNGQIMMRAFLSGTPECRFGLNDSLTIDSTETSEGYSDL